MEGIKLELRRQCPYCPLQGLTPDVGKHLYINTNKNVFYCQRCNHSGKWEGGDLPIDTMLPSLSNKFDKVELFTFDITTMNKHFNYWRDRAYEYGLTRLPEEVIKSKARWSPDLLNRIFFPVYSEGEVCMWQARTILEEGKPKFLSNGSISNYLYNLENVNDDWAVLTEGPIDALSTPNGIASFGKNLSNIHFDLIVSKYDTLYWGYDSDTRKQKSLITMKGNLKEFINVIDLDFGDKKDPNEISYLGMERILEDVGAL